MNPLAANHTVPSPPPLGRAPEGHCSFVEDLNWPAAPPLPGKKPPRRTDLWVPGPDGQWEGVPPTLQ